MKIYKYSLALLAVLLLTSCASSRHQNRCKSHTSSRQQNRFTAIFKEADKAFDVEFNINKQ